MDAAQRLTGGQQHGKLEAGDETEPPDTIDGELADVAQATDDAGNQSVHGSLTSSRLSIGGAG